MHCHKTEINHLPTAFMTIEYHFASLTMLELAIGETYRDPEARQKKYFTMPPPKVVDELPARISLKSAADIDIALKRLDEAYHIMAAFLSCDLETTRILPDVIFTRVMLALTTLLKVFHSIHSGSIKGVIDISPESIRFYLSSIRDKLLQAGDGNNYKMPYRWAKIACKKSEWFDEFQMNQWLSDLKTPICESVSFTVDTPPFVCSNLPCAARQNDIQEAYNDLGYNRAPEPRGSPVAIPGAECNGIHITFPVNQEVKNFMPSTSGPTAPVSSGNSVFQHGGQAGSLLPSPLGPQLWLWDYP
jgi:hypothetical protein